MKQCENCESYLPIKSLKLSKNLTYVCPFCESDFRQKVSIKKIRYGLLFIFIVLNTIFIPVLF